MFYSSSVFQDLSSISTVHKLFRDIGDLGVTKDFLSDGRNTPKKPPYVSKVRSAVGTPFTPKAKVGWFGLYHFIIWIFPSIFPEVLGNN